MKETIRIWYNDTIEFLQSKYKLAALDAENAYKAGTITIEEYTDRVKNAHAAYVALTWRLMQD